MTLSTDQRQAIQRGQAVRASLDGIPCVVLREDVYDRVERVLDYDDSPLTTEEKQWALAEAGRRHGWEDPEMDVYNELDPRKP